MKKFLRTAMALAMALAVGLTFSVPYVTAAEEAKKEAPAPAEAKKGAPEAKMITLKGKIEAVEKDVVIKTEDNKTYKLEGEKVKEFVGKEAEVTGTLDASGKVIQVKEIKPVK